MTRIFYRTTVFDKSKVYIVWFIAVFLLSMNALGQAKNDWHLEKDKNGIRVYSRHLDGSRLKEIKVDCEIPGSINQLVAFLSDVDQYSKVVYKNKSAQLLRRVSETDFYYYSESEMPWPATNRDLVLRLRFAYDPASKVLQINTNSVTDMVPPKEGLVRVAFWQAVWQVHAVAGNKMQIDYTFQVDPGGTLPAWLINATAAIGPYQSFLNLREKIQLPRYQKRSFGFLPATE
ncbi:START domain-containing protein [Spirosoma harenae]